MIINTIIWTVLAEYNLENKDLKIGGLILGIIILTFIYYYFKFSNYQKISKTISLKKAKMKRKKVNGS